MKSGEHALWDAHLAVAPERAAILARLERMAAALMPMREAFAGLGISATEASRRLQESFRALERASRRGSVRRQP